MYRFLHGAQLWEEIRKRAQGSKTLTAVVANLGRDCASQLKWPKDSSVIANLSEETIKEGSSSPRGGLSLLKKDVRVFENSQLHAKVYLFDKSAIVCSANLSKRSEQLLDAGILTTEAKTLKAIRKYVHSLKRNPNTYEMDDKILKARKKLEPRKKRTKPPTNKPSAEIFASSRVWLTPADPDVEETTKERKAKKEYAKEEFADEKLKITWYNRCGKAMQQRMKDYDTVFLFWNGTSRRPYGWLEGPYRALGGVDLGSKFEDRRYCIPMIKRNTKSLPLAQAGFKKVLKLQGDKRPVSKAKENISLRSKLLRGQKRARFISWVKAQRKRK